MANPTIVLRDRSFNGVLKIAYSVRSLPRIGKGERYDIEPIIRSLPDNESSIYFSSLFAAIDTFSALHELTGDSQWDRALEATLQSIEILAAVEAPFLLFRRDNSTRYALSAPGTEIQTTNPHPILALRTDEGLVRLDIPRSSGSSSSVRLVQKQPFLLAANSTIEVEVGLSSKTDGIVTLVLEISSQRWEAYIVPTPNTITRQIFTPAEFLQWSAATIWRPSSALSLTMGETGKATAYYQSVLVGQARTAVQAIELQANFDFATCSLSAKFGVSPPTIAYSLEDNPVFLRLQDGAGWFWERLLPITGGYISPTTFLWNEFTLSAYQTNSGSRPSSPDSFSSIRRLEFVATRDASVLSIFYLGAPPLRLNAPVLVQSCAISSRISDLHSLFVGDVQLSPSPNSLYSPAVVPQRLTLINGEVDGRKNRKFAIADQSPLPWILLGKPDEAEDLRRFLTQNWAGNWEESATAIVAVAREWHHNPESATAGDWIHEMLLELDKFWVAKKITSLSAISLYGQAALYVNLAGGSRALTYKILVRSLQEILKIVNTSSISKPLAASDIGFVLKTLALILQNKPSIKYPMPSDINKPDSEFAEILVKFSRFEPGLNLPKEGHYGFKFEVPISYPKV